MRSWRCGPKPRSGVLPYKKRKRDQISPSFFRSPYLLPPTPGKHSGKVIWGHSEKMAICNPGREASSNTNPDSNLSLDFQPPELWENIFLLFKLLSLCYFVVADSDPTRPKPNAMVSYFPTYVYNNNHITHSSNSSITPFRFPDLILMCVSTWEGSSHRY